MENEIKTLNILLDTIENEKGREEEEKWETPKAGNNINLDLKDFQSEIQVDKKLDEKENFLLKI